MLYANIAFFLLCIYNKLLGIAKMPTLSHIKYCNVYTLLNNIKIPVWAKIAIGKSFFNLYAVEIININCKNVLINPED